MRRRMTVLFMSVAMLAGCADRDGDGVETGTPADETAIRAIASDYATQWNNKDSTAIWSMLADDYTEVTPEGTHMADRAALQNMLRTEWAARPAGLSISIGTTFVKFLDDDAAYSGGTWNMTGMPTGEAKGSWLGVYRKVGDSTWKVVSLLASEYQAPPAALTTPADTTKPAN